MNEVSRNANPLMLSPRFAAWLEAADASLALTTYQAGRLFFIGRKPDGSVRAHERIIEQCQGLWTDGQTLWTSGLYMLWRFENVLRAGETTPAGADRKFVPREGRVTGRTDIHDIGLALSTACGGRSSSTRFTAASPRSARPRASVRCGTRHSSARSRRRTAAISTASRWTATRPAFVTAVSRSDVADGWRERRQDGGVVIDVASERDRGERPVDAAFAAAL